MEHTHTPCNHTPHAQIYLNPDNDAVWAERGVQDTAESREAVATARSLLGQVGVCGRVCRDCA